MLREEVDDEACESIVRVGDEGETMTMVLPRDGLCFLLRRLFVLVLGPRDSGGVEDGNKTGGGDSFSVGSSRTAMRMVKARW